MANLKEIRKRIQTVKKTQKTTSAMKMVSAAKFRRAQDAIMMALPYANKMEITISSLYSTMKEMKHPFVEKREENRASVIIITSDRGLCGGFNINLCKMVEKTLLGEGFSNSNYIVIGKKGADFYKYTPNVKSYQNVLSSEQDQVVNEIVKNHLDRFLSREIDNVFLAYNHFVSALTQVPVFKTLLPIKPPDTEDLDEREMKFEPSAEVILDSVIKQYLVNQIQVGWLDSVAGEQGARMTAMDSATKNAAEMIDKLQLYYNRSRQAAITKELIEIISGAESL